MALRSSLVRRGAVAAGLVYLLGSTGAALGGAPWGDDWLPGAVTVVLAVAVAGGYLAVTSGSVRRGAVAVLLLMAMAGMVQNLSVPFAGLSTAYVLAWVAPFAVRLPVAAGVVLVDAAATMLALTATGLLDLSSRAGIVVGMLFAGAFAAAIQQLIVNGQQTEVAAQARASAAVLAERQRMAREMHDLLAHSLSAQIVHLEGARMLLERGDQPERAQRQVVGALRLAREGLDETKRALAALRGDELRVVDRLAALVAEFRATGDSHCELDAGAEPVLAVEARWAVVRTAQEALTNVHKHADGARVAVRLSRSERWCELRVSDTGGNRSALADAGAGYGLTGMRERAELIGGSLVAGRCGEGFEVRLRVPLDRAEARL